ncbi:unnamed protein product [Sphenostylis stenocarpa]|uniref:Uncharacterized protein n=1 Tax=Sphenostylis stenocarpa TaxID=92480 RepID=A0AA86VCL3_9FABA|nr:unnamed protein product [Sphenostylis stenocarpa]
MVLTFRFSRFYWCGYNAFKLSDNQVEPRGEVFEKALLDCPITGLNQELILKGFFLESPPMFLPETSEKESRRPSRLTRTRRPSRLAGMARRDGGLAICIRRDGGPESETAVSTLKGKNPYFYAKNPSYPSMRPNSLS